MSSWRSGAWRSGAWRLGAWRSGAGGSAYASLETAYATASAGTLTPELSAGLIGAGAAALAGWLRLPIADAPPADISLWALGGVPDLTVLTMDDALLAQTPEQALALRTYPLFSTALSYPVEPTLREAPAPLFTFFDTTVWTITTVPATLVAMTRPAELFAVVLPEAAVTEDLPDTLTAG